MKFLSETDAVETSGKRVVTLAGLDYMVHSKPAAECLTERRKVLKMFWLLAFESRLHRLYFRVDDGIVSTWFRWKGKKIFVAFKE